MKKYVWILSAMQLFGSAMLFRLLAEFPGIMITNIAFIVILAMALAMAASGIVIHFRQKLGKYISLSTIYAQLPIFASPLLSYKISVLARANITLTFPGNIAFDIGVPGNFNIGYLSSGTSIAIGVNLFAIAMAAYVHNYIPGTRTSEEPDLRDRRYPSASN